MDPDRLRALIESEWNAASWGIPTPARIEAMTALHLGAYEHDLASGMDPQHAARGCEAFVRVMSALDANAIDELVAEFAADKEPN